MVEFLTGAGQPASGLVDSGCCAMVRRSTEGPGLSTAAREAVNRWWIRARRAEPAPEVAPRPLLRPAPRSAMFVPLVVLAAVLPGLYALNWWDLVPPGPWWGLRGLAVLHGWRLDQVPLSGVGPPHEAAVYRAVAFQPPLYAWLEAVCLGLSPSLNPLATVLPGYAAGVLVVLLTFAHGRLWRGPGLGVVAAVLMAFSRELLVQMQQASPATLGVAGLLGALLAYGRVLRADEGRTRSWLVLGAGLCLGLSLLSVSLVGLLGVAIVGVHQGLLTAGTLARHPARPRWRGGDLAAGAAVLAAAGALALMVAAPWHAVMLSRYGGEFVQAQLSPPRPAWSGDRDLLAALLALAPATLPLAALAIFRVSRETRSAAPGDPAAVGGSFWLAWLAVASLALLGWKSGPRPALSLLLLVPLNLLAARAMTDLAARRVSARQLTWLAPSTALSVAFWLGSGLRGAISHLLRGQRPGADALAMGLALAALLFWLTRRLDRWARRHDDRRRAAIGGLLAAVLAVTAGAGLREVRFRHVETTELLDLRSEILRRHRLRPLTVLAVVCPETADAEITPGGRLRFVLRTALPGLGQIDYRTTDALLSLPSPPGAQRLVVLVGPEAGLPYRLQSQLGLEALHAGRTGMLDAFATTYIPPRRRR